MVWPSPATRAAQDLLVRALTAVAITASPWLLPSRRCVRVHQSLLMIVPTWRLHFRTLLTWPLPVAWMSAPCRRRMHDGSGHYPGWPRRCRQGHAGGGVGARAGLGAARQRRTLPRGRLAGRTKGAVSGGCGGRRGDSRCGARIEYYICIRRWWTGIAGVLRRP